MVNAGELTIEYGQTNRAKSSDQDTHTGSDYGTSNPDIRPRWSQPHLFVPLLMMKTFESKERILPPNDGGKESLTSRTDGRYERTKLRTREPRVVVKSMMSIIRVLGPPDIRRRI